MSNPPWPDTYDPVADRYAQGADTAPYNAHYERPAMLTLLPDAAGAHVLDAGCGDGWYAQQLMARGARVTAVDASARMVEHARRRLGPDADVRVADLAQPLDFADATFDGIVSALALEHVRDWDAAFAELRRILRPGGWILFSAQHPAFTGARLASAHYHDVVRVEERWGWIGGAVPAFYHRPLSAMVNALAGAGFAIDRLEEPVPTDEFRRRHPDDYTRLLRQPGFLIFRARREDR
ncbi:class I SAM-dependent methyltransferase [Longimicrobium sp.]|uniref:class I SAM-dependent methyltransferase n=1 Tax=Longimicrobium sp. TaxID=2029185 RepID=UPI002E35347C|nr:class I SAM-dependent methyltransferase [Longimicrobium sp.]HEX6042494.1 class I SAM-dependent methyltransferase [Longimicrobium sp.]